LKVSKSTAKKKVKAAKLINSKATRKVRTRLTGVRGRVLNLLAAGPMTSAELVAKGGFSAASLYLNMKALKKDGMVTATRNGRSVSISLIKTASSSAPIEGEIIAAPKASTKSTSVALVPAYAAHDLHVALNDIAVRFAPITRVQDKLLVLEQLARNLPGPVSAVLKEIMGDLARLGHSA